MPLAAALARLVKLSVPLACACYAVDDWRAGRRLARGDLATRSGSRHADLDLDASLAYVERVAADYLRLAGRAAFAGDVAEVGPGDSFGTALLMRGRGARAVHTLDRYRPRRDPARQRAILEALARRHGLEGLLDAAGGIAGATHHEGIPAETFFRDTPHRFDMIVSRAVMEHLYDPLGALDGMLAALKPGGTLVHRIDLRDHGLFAGHHPLTFLTIADPLYRRMTRRSGRPNRVLAPAYAAWLERAGVPGSIRVTRLAGVAGELDAVPREALDPALLAPALAAVAAIRPRLTAPFRGLADADLAVAGIVLVAAKPDQGASTAANAAAAASSP